MGDRGRRWGRGGALVVSVALVTGCVGSIDRSDFDELVRERGGGLSGDLVVDALAAIEAHEESPSLEVMQVALTSDTVSVSVRSPAFPDELDGWTFTLGHDLNGPSPEPDIDAEDAVAFFAADDVDAASIEASIDQAVDQTSVRQGWADSAYLRGDGSGSYELQVVISNDRTQETWVFDAAGNVKVVQ